MSTVIQVENLSKKYIISHQKAERYSTLRDVLSNKFNGLFKKIFNPPNVDVQTSNLPKEEFWALQNVSFEVKQGDRIGIIGRNGAGKSTLLKILSRITDPTGGRVSIKGKVASLLEVGTGFHPELTGRENLFLNGAILGMSKKDIKKKFDEIVSFAEVEKFLDTPVKHYSSGMYVRLAFAVAAHLEPEILLVDEILAVGDMQFQNKCLWKMEEVGKEGRTVLFVSHNMGVINKLCPKTALFEKGCLKTFGKTNEVIQSYYLSNDQNQSAITEFPETDQDVQIRKTSILNINNEPSGQIPICEPFTIEIEYEFLKVINNALLIVVFHFFNEYLFLSAESDKNMQMKDYLPGKYATKVKIPAFLFNVGIYNFEVAIHRPYELDFVRIKNIHFEITDINDPKSIIFKGNKFGRFAIMLDYETKLLQ